MKDPEEKFEGSPKLGVEDARQVEPLELFAIYVITIACRFEALRNYIAIDVLFPQFFNTPEILQTLDCVKLSAT